MAKDKYIISLWEDYPVSEEGNIPRHYEEREIAVIGSDSMTADCRAVEPKLVENVNGTNTLTFKMFYVYTDEHGEKYQNPFLNLLVNERKVKVFWKDKWYDLVIKNCQENSEDKSITYTCTDLFINELSKTGFDIELDADLNNNQGTAEELAQKVLEGTDWVVDLNSCQTIQQEKEEPVYEFTLENSLDAINETAGASGVTIDSGSKILFFYQEIQDIIQSSATSGSSYLQFAYAENYTTEANSQLVVNADCYSTENALSWEIKNRQTSAPYIDFGETGKLYYNTHISDRYRASRLVKSQKCSYDPLTEKYCYVYEALDSIIETTASASDGDIDPTGGEESSEASIQYVADIGDLIYCYRSVEFKDPTVVNNLVTNNRDFTDTTGWTDTGAAVAWYPVLDASSTGDYVYSGKSYLKITGVASNSIQHAANDYLPEGFRKGDTFIFRYIARKTNSANNAPTSVFCTDSVGPIVKPYIGKSRTETYFDLVSNTPTCYPVSSDASEGYWVEYQLTCKKSATISKIYEEKIKLIFGITKRNNEQNSVWFQEVQLFPLVEGEDPQTGQTKRINPGEMDTLSISQTYYTYYNYTKSQSYINKNDIQDLYHGTTEWNEPKIKAVYNDNFEKIRSITVKQSNRFNILQTIAETFECWMDFQIEHDQSGKTIYDNGCPRKKVIIKKDLGQEVGVGFVYGIDLKSIQRTIQSDQIVTKTIVSPNANEHATNGFCTIARSEENYPHTNFILNFDYYITQGLLDGGELNRDLYLTTPDVIGYYYNLNRLNKQYDEITDLYTQKNNELTKQKALLEVYDTTVTALTAEITQIEADLVQYTGVTWGQVSKWVAAHPTDQTANTYFNNYKVQTNQKNFYIDLRDKLQISVNKLTEFAEGEKSAQKAITDELKDLNLQFYKKYSRYIQEGSWTSEDYMDDNLYYLDALSVAYTSSRPQISYTISVLRLSYLEEFKNKVFHLGDISFIQDTEFFGYVDAARKTPYKEKVLVSEIVSNFDDPSQDTITIQNYKTQFEDLFQRITSTTQSLQYASGQYARAASIVEPEGIINPQTLQNSIAFNEQLVISAQNESVITDATGITVTDVTDPNKKTKVTSGGVIFTIDGGRTWTSAITGGGLNTQALTAGAINVDSITVLNGLHSSFRWDNQGINAFYQSPAGINLSKFVRYDYNGIYGWYGEEDPPTTYEGILASAPFGMTWNGFFMRNIDGNHYVEISNEKDIVVVDATNSAKPIDRVKIGKLGDNYYGMRLRNSNGDVTLETTDSGSLWLKDSLHIGTTDSQSFEVALGSLGIAAGESVQRVIYAGTTGDSKEFIVYEDGTMKATGGTFTGTINATGGTIGNLTIDQIETGIEEVAKGAYKVVISAPSGGTIFVDSNPINLTAALYQGDSRVSGNMSYKWYRNGVEISGATSSTISAIASPSDTSTYVYTCEITYPV